MKRKNVYATLWFIGGVLFVLLVGVAASVGAARELGPMARASVAPACPGGEPAAGCRTTVTGTVEEAHLEESPLQQRPGHEPEDHWVYRVQVDPETVPATTKFWLDRPSLGLIEVTPRRVGKLMKAGDQVTLELLHDDVVQVTNESGDRFYGGEANEPVVGWVTVPLAVGSLTLLYGAALVVLGRLSQRRQRGQADAPAGRKGTTGRSSGLLVGLTFGMIPIVFGASVVAAIFGAVSTHFHLTPPRLLAPIALAVFVLVIIACVTMALLWSRRGKKAQVDRGAGG